MSSVINIVTDKSDLAMRRKKLIKQLVEEPLFQGAIDEVRETLMNNLMFTKVTDASIREAMYFEARALDMIVERLKAYANDVTFSITNKVSDHDS